MDSIFSFTHKASNFGINPPQDHDRTIRRKIGNDQRPETHFPKTGRDGGELKIDRLKQGNGGENEPKKKDHPERGNETTAFWTVCPYCYHMYEYEKKYEDCCLLCQNCNRGFHGLAVMPPPERFQANGNVGEYYFGYDFFPLGYSRDNGFFSDKEHGEKQAVVEISDDSDDEKKVCEAKKDGLTRRVKSVPKNPKKVFGRGIKIQAKEMIEKMHVVEMNEEFWKEVDKNGGGGSNEDDGLDFVDDIFVGLRDIC
ncbi:hypothetical protein F3Y22_tig00111769pilonHSYRG00199 [Hibiscus syriacus]|uniref:Zinc beta-ribbon domain-containing protein n=1 Tax=Hibiscus syriacus TaxID=106335 RepID=A0A6A2XDV3_HIBSY|nr:hypothetical protein F3Y22_tig00111769pilonHSYRG00199 [Hibiscus syriacus]